MKYYTHMFHIVKRGGSIRPRADHRRNDTSLITSHLQPRENRFFSLMWKTKLRAKPQNKPNFKNPI